ncbi:FtsX-like permease family protein [Cryobacterium sp. PH31-AA6]|uniref:ABC transporter permease n=1 Tax=Cryobacterium sp. PH31-AA6 TaxID=3046205 RepID=UPI0024BB2D81|nr:ABC transporter permease [Cryobacterium sp. PH31-AA6]MDJ0322199.1 FtsX-like permease family protein [Cryobacterium sp. PH31-AA6]
MKFIDIVKTAIANSFRSKVRTGLTVIAIFIGAFTLTITSGIGTGVTSYIDTQVTAIGAADVLTISKAADSTSSATEGPAAYDPSKATTVSLGNGSRPGTTIQALTAKDITAIGKTTGILRVDPSVRVTPDYIEYDGNGKFELIVNAAATLTTADLAAGAQLDNSSTTDEVLLPTTYLKNLGFADAKAAIGKTVSIGITDYTGVQQEAKATVIGVQNETILGVGAGLNQHLTDGLQAIQVTGAPAGASDSYATATALFDASSTAAEITAIKDDLATQGYASQTVADTIGSFQTVINVIIGVLNAFAVIALIAAGFGIINTLLMSVQERTREIGLMKAMGMNGGRVYTLFSTEAVFIGFLGSALGALAAVGVGSVVSNILADGVFSALPGLQVVQFAPSSIAIIIGVVMLIAFLAGTLPARSAARQNPIDALRYE